MFSVTNIGRKVFEKSINSLGGDMQLLSSPELDAKQNVELDLFL